jgi:hypothetical protein
MQMQCTAEAIDRAAAKGCHEIAQYLREHIEPRHE